MREKNAQSLDISQAGQVRATVKVTVIDSRTGRRKYTLRSLAIWNFMTGPITPDKLNARFAAAATLSASAKIITKGFLTFSSFLITGFSAVLGFTVGNMEKVEPLVSRDSVKAALSLFLWALALHVIQRYLASIVAGNAASLKASQKIFSEDRQLDWEEYCRQVKIAMWRPAQWLLTRWISKVSDGDIAVVSRLAIGLAQTQGILAVLQAGLIGWAAYTLLNHP